MKTVEIDERVILTAVSKCWMTAKSLVGALGAPASAQRKIMGILSVLAAVGKLKTRIRTDGKRGRPPTEFRRA